MTTEDLKAIVAGSSTVFERLADDFVPDQARAPEESIDARLERWRKRVASGDPLRFERYLRWHGIEVGAARRAVTPASYVADELPEWAQVLADVVTLGSEVIEDAPAGSAHESPVCFEAILRPFLAAARRRLAARVPSAHDEMMGDALPALERALLRYLAHVAGRTLYAEFAAFRVAEFSAAAAHGAMARSLASLMHPEHSVVYETFTRHLREGGLVALFRRYPVLARLLANSVIAGADAIAELLNRVAADRPLIEHVFGGGAPIGAVMNVAPALSDPHCGWRTVARLTFASGLELVYKPRSVALEAAFSSLLEWLNDDRVATRLKAPVVLDRGPYGWMEYVAPDACRNEEEVATYYRRAGMLLCLGYALGGADLHHGNLVAHGAHPVLVDLEVLMMAPARLESPDASDHDLDAQQVWDSVLRTGLLPITRPTLRGRYVRSGGLTGANACDGRPYPHWQQINTDFMRLEMRPGAPAAKNLPRLHGRMVPCGEHVDSVVAGFDEMWGVLRREHCSLARPDGPLAAFRGRRNRIVLRDTRVYATLAEQALHPHVLTDGAEWSIEFEILKAATTKASSKPHAWPVWLAEPRALCRLNIPMFESNTDSTAIRADGDKLLDDYLQRPGDVETASRLPDSRDGSARGVHVQCVRVALREPYIRVPPAGSSGDAFGALREEARSLGAILRRAAYTPGDGRVGWVGIRGSGSRGRRFVDTLDWDLYSGRCGVALFFAALERHGLAEPGASFASQILEPLVDDLLARRHTLDWSAIGACGIGGVVYALTRASAWLQFEGCLDAAESAAALVTPASIDRDDSLDVMSGTAGAALGLLVLDEMAPGRCFAEAAVRCAQHLLDRSCRDRYGRRVWHSRGRPLARGFAHGSAGIGYALARVYRSTALEIFRAAAIDALEAGMAEDETTPTCVKAPRLADSWCQGRPGIVAARIAAADLLGAPELRCGVEALLGPERDSREECSRSDQACCGNVGYIDVLISASARLRDDRWSSSAIQAAAHVVERAAGRGTYALGAVDDVFCPGFYPGLAGIGYGLLRTVDRSLPSVLLWE